MGEPRTQRMQTLSSMARAPFREGDKVAFRRSTGAIAYGTVSTVHEHSGEVTITFCDQTLYKTLPYAEVSSSVYPFAVGARRTKGRTTGRKIKPNQKWYFMTDNGEFGPFNSRSSARSAADKETGHGSAGEAIVYQGRYEGHLIRGGAEGARRATGKKRRTGGKKKSGGCGCGG